MQTKETTIERTGIIGVLIVDDQPTFLAVARTVVSIAAGFEVVGQAASGEEAVAIAEEAGPQLVLMDINLGGINGVEATRQILATHPDTVVILMSTYTVEDLPADAKTVGAARYVHKEDLSPSVLREVWDERFPPDVSAN